MFAAIRWLIGFIIAIAILIFAVLNRDSVALTYSFIHDPVSIPLYAIGLGMMGFGYLFGAATIWISDSKLRRERRKQRKNIKSLTAELDDIRIQPNLHTQAPTPTPGKALPAITKEIKT